MRELITTVRIEEGPGHDHVHVWNRGGKAGVLTVDKGDAEAIARRLNPANPIQHMIEPEGL